MNIIFGVGGRRRKLRMPKRIVFLCTLLLASLIGLGLCVCGGQPAYIFVPMTVTGTACALLLSKASLLLTLPLRIPVRRSDIYRWTPELCAFIVYSVFLVMIMKAGSDELFPDRVMASASVSYMVAGGLLTALPICLAHSILAAERAQGTLEAVLLMPVNRSKLAWGRLVHLVLLGLRLMAWLLPLYWVFTYAGNLIVGQHNPPALRFATMYIFAPTYDFCNSFAVLHTTRTSAGFGAWGMLLMCGRLLRDFCSYCLASSLAFYISVRIHSFGRSLLAGVIAIPTTFAAFYVAESALFRWLHVHGWWTMTWAWSVGCLLAFLLLLSMRVLIAYRGVSLIAAGFDHYLIGEK